jgi:hypothetical protein
VEKAWPGTIQNFVPAVTEYDPTYFAFVLVRALAVKVSRITEGLAEPASAMMKYFELEKAEL